MASSTYPQVNGSPGPQAESGPGARDRAGVGTKQGAGSSVRRVAKLIAILLGGVIGLIVIGVATLYIMGSGRMGKRYEVPLAAVTIPTDQASISRGQHLVEAVAGCVGCHGENLAGGRVMANDPAFAVIYASNITRGKGGLDGEFGDAEYVRAIRHGLRRDGTPMMIMPSQHYAHLSDRDLGAIIAYLKTVPPVDNDVPGPSIGPIARILLATGAIPPLAAEVIDHDGPSFTAPEAAASAEYGAYLAEVGGCSSCHGANLSGAQPPDPASPPAPGIHRDGLAGWSQADFFHAMRDGVTPTGKGLTDFMPWKEYTHMTDDELKAIWLYLQSVPSKN